jgi:hypothetical protein
VHTAACKIAQQNGLFIQIGADFKLGKKPLQEACRKIFNFWLLFNIDSLKMIIIGITRLCLIELVLHLIFLFSALRWPIESTKAKRIIKVNEEPKPRYSCIKVWESIIIIACQIDWLEAHSVKDYIGKQESKCDATRRK